MDKIATFAGGCFWCMVKPYTMYEGVIKVESGYMGGTKENPTYEEVSTGDTKHLEVIQIYFDDDKISYNELLNIYWKQINPYDPIGQFADVGSQYLTAIFYHDDEQKKLAEKSKKTIEEKNGKAVYTQIRPIEIFYKAEEYHQDYYKKSSKHYNIYYKNSGRYNYVKSHWDRNNANREILKDKLTDLQFEVTQNDMTEIPFENEYFDKFEKGIYVDIVSGEPLFSSNDKFQSSCGWPSFSKPIKDTNILYRGDYSFGMERTEVRSAQANSHLGHLFNHGPKELGGNRYCINSASLKFIPYDKMDEEGYGEYKKYLD
ncbi:peptide-methionine (R)-S-oxide reductase MsrB [Peptostreptococcus equinus]|uniref:Peptide methionine sulfoxide reductase MsrA n=1 Tax=Peptostreptococcus equinus TaxID=3003601 RepID=A0ABY7JT68_9FIRM|nr:peptide-methionine (R)-S-oxide reductase MsrB [Peptostreptococcus sp. CBA3647]WAW15674.1 peptide-methionine (R)-S-oxide reductase MsrB [Peptostreptococcus sp. CBA3647]